MLDMKIRMSDKCAFASPESRYKANGGGFPGNNDFLF
jgi:hypothetical protein